MFSTEKNGYSKAEVDEYIAQLRQKYEQQLVEARLKILELEKSALEYKSKARSIEMREQNIMSALDLFKRYQDEGERNIDQLRLAQFGRLYQEFLGFVKELVGKYSELNSSKTLEHLIADFEIIIQKSPEGVTGNEESDSMRRLLSKMRGQKHKTAQSTSASRIRSIAQSLGTPASNAEKSASEQFLSTPPAPVPAPAPAEQEEYHFDLKAAVTPTEGLEEILRAFDLS